METRNLVTAMLASMAVFLLWMAIAPKLGFQPTQPPATQPADDLASASRPAGPDGAPSTASGPARATTTAAEPYRAAAYGTEEETVRLGSTERNGRFELEAVFTNRGGAIKQVRLANHFLDVDVKDPYPILDAVVAPSTDSAPERAFYSWATEKIRIVGSKQDIMLSEVLWQKQDVRTDLADGTHVVTFAITIERHEKPLVQLTKRYTLHPTDPGDEKVDGKRRFHATVDLEVENRTDQPVSVILTQRGPLGIPKEDPRSDMRFAVGAVVSGDGVATAGEASHGELEDAEDGTKTLVGAEADARFAWGAIQNKYFAAYARPLSSGRANEPSITECRARTLTDAELDNDFTIELVTSPIELAAGQTKSLSFQAYFGPKSQKVFEGEAYRGAGYENLISFGLGSCTFERLTKLMIWLLHTFQSFTHNYGLAIIMLVVIVRTVLHPVTKKGQVNMMKMQKSMAALQPKMEELKTRYGNDRQKLNTEMMVLYREEGVNPAGNFLTCLPMFLQMPIWVALWTALASTIEMRHAPLLVEGYWIKDLTRPDALIEFGRGFHVPLLSSMPYVGEFESFNILPILLGISMYLQQRFMSKLSKPPTQPGKNPDQMAQQQAQQQKIMSFMTIFFTFMFYNAPSGLNLYIMASNFFGLIEQHRIRKHIREEEAKGKFEPKKKKQRKPGQLSWIEWLQKKAQDAQQAQPSRKRK